MKLKTTKSPLALSLSIVVILLLLAIGSPSHGANQPTSSNKPATLLILGDSLSAGYGIDVDKGWATLLQHRIEQQNIAYRVINGSISGNTTADGLNRLPALISHYQPSIILVALGANDGLRGYSIKTMQANLVNIIKVAKASGAEVMITHMEIPPNYGKRYTKSFKDAFSKVAAQENIKTLPFFLYELINKPEFMLADGIHPNALAQPLILDTLWPAIKNNL